VWDPDIQPEGAALSSHFSFLDELLRLDSTAFFYVVDEIGAVNVTTPGGTTGIVTTPNPDNGTPFMYGLQTGLSGRPLDWLRTGVRGSYYRYSGVGLSLADALMAASNGGGAIHSNPLIAFVDGTAQQARADGTMQQLVGDVFATFTPWGERWAITPY